MIRAPYVFGLKGATKIYWRRFQKHRINSIHRGVEFKLTFEQWLKIWKDSGRINESGRGKKKYCMARFGDVGAYEVGNVRIITNEENQRELLANPAKLVEIGNGMRGKKHTAETRGLMSKQRMGNQYAKGLKHSAETKAIIGAKSAANWQDPVYAKRGSEVMKTVWEDPNYRKRVGASQRKSWKNTSRRKATAIRMCEYNEKRKVSK